MAIRRRNLVLAGLLALFYSCVGLGFRHLADLPDDWLDPDGIADLADTLCAHGEFAAVPGEPELRQAPLYPASLAAACSIFNVDVRSMPFILNGLCHLLLLLVLASHPLCNSSRGATAAIVAVGLDPLLLVYAGRTYREPMVIAVVALVVFTIDRLLTRPRIGAMFALGASWGTSLIVKPILMYLGVFLVPVLFFAKRSARWLLLGALPIGLLCILPWSIRNYRLTDTVMPVGTGAWTSILYGDIFAREMLAAGNIEDLQRLATEGVARLDEELKIGHLEPYERERFYREYWIEHHLREPWLVVRKVAIQQINFWVLGGSVWKSVAFALLQLPLVGLGAFAIWKSWGERRELYLGFVTVALYMMSVHSVSLAVARYSMPLRPWLIVICVTFLSERFKRAGGRGSERLGQVSTAVV